MQQQVKSEFYVAPDSGVTPDEIARNRKDLEIDVICLFCKDSSVGMGNGVDQKYESFKNGNFALL